MPSCLSSCWKTSCATTDGARVETVSGVSPMQLVFGRNPGIPWGPSERQPRLGREQFDATRQRRRTAARVRTFARTKLMLHSDKLNARRALDTRPRVVNGDGKRPGRGPKSETPSDGCASSGTTSSARRYRISNQPSSSSRGIFRPCARYWPKERRKSLVKRSPLPDAGA